MEKKVIAIHQPNYFPWLGYFMKMAHSDIFVFHDQVQITKSGPTRRVKISARHTPNHLQWMTVPLVKHSDHALIKDLVVTQEVDWAKKHLRQIYEAYRKCAFFGLYYPILETWYAEAKTLNSLGDVNIFFINKLKELLSITTNCVFSSELPVSGKATTYNIYITKYLYGTHYLSGKGGNAYQDKNLFDQHEIVLLIQDSMYHIQQNPYPQFSDSKEKGLSVLDPLMNIGVDGVKPYLSLVPMQ